MIKQLRLGDCIGWGYIYFPLEGARKVRECNGYGGNII